MNLRAFCLLLLVSAAAADAQVPPEGITAAEAAQVQAMRAGADPGSDFGPRPDEERLTPEEAAQVQASQHAAAEYFRRVATGLAATGGARELAFAAALLPLARMPPALAGPRGMGDNPPQISPPDPRADEWRRLGSARAGKDVLANAMLATTMVIAGTEESGDALSQGAARWRQLEPDNLAPRLFDNGAVDDWLPGAAAYTHYDQHYYEQTRWMQSDLRACPPSPAERSAMTTLQQSPAGTAATSADVAALTLVLGIQSAMASPALGRLLEACRGEALASMPNRRSDCQHVAHVMADASDTSLGKWVGIGLLERTAKTAEERADAGARRRRIDWQMSQWGRLSSGEPFSGAAQFARLLGDPAIQREQDLIERMLGDAGVPLEPPSRLGVALAALTLLVSRAWNAATPLRSRRCVPGVPSRTFR